MEWFALWTALLLSLPILTNTPKTTVILLDNNSSHNAIVVTTDAGSLIVDQPYTFTTLSSLDAKPSQVQQADPQQIEQTYANHLSALPSKPVSILFYFDTGTELTEASKNRLQELIEIIQSRSPAAVDIIGHTDRAGDADKNYELALQRAYAVEKFLHDHAVKMERSTIVSYGENDLLIPTEDGIAEPKNRRVEVVIR